MHNAADFVVANKPPCLPTAPTVDNLLESCPACVGMVSMPLLAGPLRMIKAALRVLARGSRCLNESALARMLLCLSHLQPCFVAQQASSRGGHQSTQSRWNAASWHANKSRLTC